MRYPKSAEKMIAQRWERNLTDVGDQTLMRRLGFPRPPPVERLAARAIAFGRQP
jgi:hypothetical protein